MIVWNILGWMLVIILSIIFLPIFVELLYVLGYVLFWTVMIICVIIGIIKDAMIGMIKPSKRKKYKKGELNYE